MRSTATLGTGGDQENPFCARRGGGAALADYLMGAQGRLGRRRHRDHGERARAREPVYDKLDGDLARGLMTINAVKGVEIGAGFAAAALKGGERRRDADRGWPRRLSNNAGGIRHPTGQDIVAASRSN
jgi:chorismate synthase